MNKIRNYINGELVAPQSNQYIDNINPSTGKVYSLIPDSDQEDVKIAVEAADKAFPMWSNMPATERSAWLMKVSEGIEARLEEFARAESIDNGKPIKLARAVDIPRAVKNFSFYATAILHFQSESHYMEGGVVNYTLRRPFGVAACISPWNLPLYLFSWKIAPALAAGNTVVAKPSEITPMTAYLLSEVCVEVGFPKGVLNIVHGYGHRAGEAMIKHPIVKAISFTGGTKTGARIASIAAPQFKKLSLELGGKNPNVIFADCDFERALKTTLNSSFSNQGQICLCGSRILIERPIYEKFKTALCEKVSQLKPGPPLNEETRMGALVSESHLEKVLGYVQLAREEGGKVLCGGNRVKLEGEFAEGYYMEPTIIEGLGPECRTNREEIFGPVVTLQPFDSEEEAVKLANAVEYGLSSTVWTQNLNTAHRVAEKIEAGIVWINCWLLRDLRTPFGGIKSSGMGREGGWEALQFFTEPKNVCIDYHE